jgi:hypothetical protein
MKKTFIYISAFIAVISAASCSKDFLALDPQSTIPATNFYKTEADLSQAVTACYSPVRDLTNVDYWLYGEMRSDNSFFQYNNANRGLETQREYVDEFLVSATSETVQELWTLSYKSISNCNDVLAHIDDASISSDATKNQFIGEVEFLRAYNYFILVQQFGGVPLRLTSVTSPADAPSTGRASVDEVYTQIIADLTDAVSKLPVSYDAGQKGRATKGAAETVLANVYMVQKNWDGAITALRDVMSLGYSLLPDYHSIWDPANKNNAESIFEIQYLGSQSGLSSSFMYTFVPFTSGSNITGDAGTGLGVGSGWNIPTQDMLDAYEPDDKRKDASLTVGFTDETGAFVNMPYVTKYNWGFTSPGQTNVDFILYRYADVLLMLAEALNEKGYNVGEPFSLINEVRKRAGLEDLTAVDVPNQSSFRDTVAHERRVELAFENHRWYDLVRTGKAVSVMNANGVYQKANYSFYPAASYNVTENKLLLPIPQREITIDKLEQNPQ